MLSRADMYRIVALADGDASPHNGFEKHLIRAIEGKCRACTVREKAWFDYWQAYLKTDRSFIPDIPEDHSTGGDCGLNDGDIFGEVTGINQSNELEYKTQIRPLEKEVEEVYKTQIRSLGKEVDDLYEMLENQRDKSVSETKNHMEIIMDLRQRLLSRGMS